jgi:SAM-dependent methyltransferase
MSWNRWMPYDDFERHHVVAKLLRKHLDTKATVLDVGGHRDLLSRFVPFEVTAINPDGSGDLHSTEKLLPFEDGHFDAVVNLDTLEHIPSLERESFIRECLRVTSRLCIIAAPWGSPEHAEAEQSLNDLYKGVYGHGNPYLDEHIAFGLPDHRDLQMIHSCAEGMLMKTHYAGSFTWQYQLTKGSLEAHSMGRWRARWRVLCNRIRCRALWHFIKINTHPNPKTNRFYCVLLRQ